MWGRLFEDCEPTDAFVCRDKEPPCGFITLKDKKENVDKAFEKNSKHHPQANTPFPTKWCGVPLGTT